MRHFYDFFDSTFEQLSNNLFQPLSGFSEEDLEKEIERRKKEKLKKDSLSKETLEKIKSMVNNPETYISRINQYGYGKSLITSAVLRVGEKDFLEISWTHEEK